MKSIRPSVAILLAFAFIITGCPISSSYPLGEKSSALPFDSKLIGTWKSNDKESEAQVITIERGNSENIYKLTVVEKGDAFMADADQFNAWAIQLEGKKFLVLQERDGSEAKQSYFVYHFTARDNEITSNDITLKVKGTEAITSVKSYQEEVIASMKKEGFLASTLVWKKQK